MYDKDGKPLFIKNYHYVVRDKDPRMSNPMKAVYMVLLSYHEHNDSVFPSNATIAEYSMLAERTVKQATKNLAEIGLITKQARFDNSNVYLVHPYSAKGKAIYPDGVHVVHEGVHGMPQGGASDAHYNNNYKNTDKNNKNLKPLSQNNSLDGSEQCSEKSKRNCDKREPIKSNCEEKAAAPEPEPNYDYEDDLPI